MTCRSAEDAAPPRPAHQVGPSRSRNCPQARAGRRRSGWRLTEKRSRSRSRQVRGADRDELRGGHYSSSRTGVDDGNVRVAQALAHSLPRERRTRALEHRRAGSYASCSMRSRHKSAITWLCLLVYGIAGMVRTHGILLCIGGDHVAFATVDAPCACCASAAAECETEATPAGSNEAGSGHAHERNAAPCGECKDVALPGRDDRLPQHPLQKAKEPPWPVECAPVVSTACAAPMVVPKIRLAATCRAPPVSLQSPLRLLRTVLLLV